MIKISRRQRSLLSLAILKFNQVVQDCEEYLLSVLPVFGPDGIFEQSLLLEDD